jgi:hypothetical protein
MSGVSCEAPNVEEAPTKTVLLKGTTSEPVLSEVEWMPQMLRLLYGFSR